MRYVQAAACSSLRVQAWSESASLSATLVEPSTSTDSPDRSALSSCGNNIVMHRLQRFGGWRGHVDEFRVPSVPRRYTLPSIRQ